MNTSQNSNIKDKRLVVTQQSVHPQTNKSNPIIIKERFKQIISRKIKVASQIDYCKKLHSFNYKAENQLD